MSEQAPSSPEVRSQIALRQRAERWQKPKAATLRRFRRLAASGLAAAVLAVAVHGAVAQQAGPPDPAALPSHSTTIALTSDDQRLVVVNREANTVSIIRVRNGSG